MTVVASLTTIPSRINADCKKAIDSLIHQVDKVYLSVSKYYKRFDTSITIPESFLREEPYKTKLVVTYCEDYGPASKYLGSLQHIADDAWIFFCDDDQVYEPSLIDRMRRVATDKSKVYQNRYDTFMRYGTGGGLIHGYVGNMVHKSLLSKLPEFPLPESARFVDDQWMSAYYFMNNTPVLTTGIDSYRDIFAELTSQGWELCGADSLIGEGNRYAHISELESYFRIKFMQNVPGCEIKRV